MRNNQNDKNRDIKANKEFSVAEKWAHEAEKKIAEARKLLEEYKIQSERLENWKRIMSTSPVAILTVIFIVVAIVEYLISRKLYMEFNRYIPYIIALGFFAVGIFLSELMVYFLSANKREWKLYEMNRNPHLDHLTDDEKQLKVKKSARNSFWIGVMVSIVLLVAIGYLSKQRVLYEINAGMRNNGFGIMDSVPIILYAVELGTGMFVVYLFNRLSLGIKVSRLWKKFNKNVDEAHRFTANAVKKYQDAEKLQYDPFRHNVSDSVHEAFYRHAHRSIEDKEQYIEPVETVRDVFNVKFVDQNGNPLSKVFHVVTDYKFSASGATNGNEPFALVIDKTFPGDAVQHIYVKDNSETKDYVTITGHYELDKNQVHTIILED